MVVGEVAALQRVQSAPAAEVPAEVTEDSYTLTRVRREQGTRCRHLQGRQAARVVVHSRAIPQICFRMTFGFFFWVQIARGSLSSRSIWSS